MEYELIAKVVNTHGIKGELKVVCNYKGKNYPGWKKDTSIYYHQTNYQKLVINTVRTHKNYLLISFANFENINQVLFLKNKDLFVTKSQLVKCNFSNLVTNLVSYQVQEVDSHKLLGKIIAFYNNNHSGLWIVETQKNNKFFLPNLSQFIKKVDNRNCICYVVLIPGMISDEAI